jgi:phenol 2-monooxygenase (NADPH)
MAFGIIPHEGGYLVRMYIELDKPGAQERIADRHMTVDELLKQARSDKTDDGGTG